MGYAQFWGQERIHLQSEAGYWLQRFVRHFGWSTSTRSRLHEWKTLKTLREGEGSLKVDRTGELKGASFLRGKQVYCAPGTVPILRFWAARVFLAGNSTKIALTLKEREVCFFYDCSRKQLSYIVITTNDREVDINVSFRFKNLEFVNWNRARKRTSESKKWHRQRNSQEIRERELARVLRKETK